MRLWGQSRDPIWMDKLLSSCQPIYWLEIRWGLRLRLGLKPGQDLWLKPGLNPGLALNPWLGLKPGQDQGLKPRLGLKPGQNQGLKSRLGLNPGEDLGYRTRIIWIRDCPWHHWKCIGWNSEYHRGMLQGFTTLNFCVLYVQSCKTEKELAQTYKNNICNCK